MLRDARSSSSLLCYNSPSYSQPSLPLLNVSQPGTLYVVIGNPNLSALRLGLRAVSRQWSAGLFFNLSFTR
jgi:hypothetical protein